MQSFIRCLEKRQDKIKKIMCHTKKQEDHNWKVKRLFSNTDNEMNHTYCNLTRILKQSSWKCFSKQIHIL